MSYVVITGASAGIGEVFARILAAQKHPLILIARREDRLNALAAELTSAYGIDAQIIAADLAQESGVQHVVATIQARQWALAGLINNAGFGDRGAFAELGLQRQLDMIQVNITSLVSMTWQLLPLLRQRQGSFIINVASTAAFQAGPNMAIYYASKAFVLSFSEALHEELRKPGQGHAVQVSALCPGPTESEFAVTANMTDTKLFKAGTMSAEKVVQIALAKRQRAIVIPGLLNLLMVWSGKLTPRVITRRLAAWLQA